ncbi:MAG: hypothetical protein ABI823_04905 [Bryobacteraceae bacterium]
MRTTIEIPDDLYRRIKSRASKQGLTLKEAILRSLKAQVTQRSSRKKGPITDPPWVASKEPGILDLTNDQIYEAIPFP